MLRSQHPAGAEQEIFAFLLAHHALRDLMTTPPGTQTRIRTGSPSPAPCASPAATSPAGRRFPLPRLARALTAALREIRERLLPSRRSRANPRVVNRRMSDWALKRTRHRNPP